MSLLFWDVDTHAEYFDPANPRYVPNAERIQPGVERLTAFAHQHRIRILASADPGKQRLPGAALKNPVTIEPGLQDPAELSRRVQSHDGDILVIKPHPDVFTNPNLLPLVRSLDPNAIVMYGIATDGGDRFTVEGLQRHRPHTRIYLVMDAARSREPKVTEHFIKEWAEEGVRLVKAEEILDGEILEPYLRET